MAGLKQTRRTFTRVLVLLLAVDAAAAAFLFSPWGRSRSAREQEYDELRGQLQSTMKQVLPLHGMDQKLERARKDIGDFYQQRLPGESSAISTELGKLAVQNSVRISQVRYEFKDADLAGLRQVKVEAGLSGDYMQEVKFINALERDKIFFILNGISLEEQQGGDVRLNLRMETYVKTGG